MNRMPDHNHQLRLVRGPRPPCGGDQAGCDTITRKGLYPHPGYDAVPEDKEDSASVRGGRITGVFHTEYLFQWKSVASTDSPTDAGAEVWLSNWLWVRTSSDSGVFIFNALDENGISNRVIEDEYNRSTALNG